MLKIPAKSEFPLGKAHETQREWLNQIKTTGCMSCHALGTKGTRTMPKDFAHMKSAEAWARRIQSGQALTQMARDITRLDSQRALALFGDWTDRIAAGELPFAKPERPQGIERNIVLTLWDWSTPTGYLHDLISTDRRKPTVNANGKLYGAPEESTDFFPVLDPKTHTGERGETPGARSEDAVLEERPDGALAVLGAQADLGQPDQHSQPDDGREGPRLDRRARAPARQSGFLQEGLGAIRRPRCSRSIARRGISPCTIRRAASSR